MLTLTREGSLCLTPTLKVVMLNLTLKVFMLNLTLKVVMLTLHTEGRYA